MVQVFSFLGSMSNVGVEGFFHPSTPTFDIEPFYGAHSAPLQAVAFQLVRRKPKLERERGIEPPPLGRKHRILPLNYSRIIKR